MTLRPRLPRTLLALGVSALVSLGARDAAAQNSPAIEAFTRGRTVAQRVRAAGSLARLRPIGGREALEVALDDRSPAIRRAAALALGHWGDPASVPTLTRHDHDANAGVRTAVLGAVREIASHAPAHPVATTAATTAPPNVPRPVNWRTVRSLVALGTMSNRATRDGHHTTLLQDALRVALCENPTMALDPGALPAAARVRLRQGHIRRYAIEGSLTVLRPQAVPGQVAVRAEVAMVLVAEPAHNIIGTISGAATAEAPTPPANDTRDPRPALERRAIEGAAHGAVSQLATTLLPRARR